MSEIERATAAMLEFGAAMERSVDVAVRELAPPHRSAVSITWEHDRYGNTTVVVTLDNGDTIWGTGPAKLEAIAAAQRAVG